MVFNKEDEKYIKKCFILAKKGGFSVFKNPLVGCVIVKNGEIISKGYHKKYGEFHAERNAILNANDKDLEGSTLYVNLEPCSHFGKTPPCTDLIIEKKIKRVCYSNSDPNLKVDGHNKLIQAGIEVVKGVLEKEGEELNKVFFKNIKTKTPYIAIKTGTTLDSKIATKDFQSKWITNEFSRCEVMKLRSSYMGILTGSNTVLTDNPHLTSRIKNGISPVRIVIDREGKLDNSANIFNNDVRVIVVSNSEKKYPVNVEKIPFKNMQTLMKTLYEKGITSILVEAGGKLNGILLEEKLVDEIYQFISPKILGEGINFTSGLNLDKLSLAIKTKDLKIKKFKEDILLNYKLVY